MAVTVGLQTTLRSWGTAYVGRVRERLAAMHFCQALSRAGAGPRTPLGAPWNEMQWGRNRTHGSGTTFQKVLLYLFSTSRLSFFLRAGNQSGTPRHAPNPSPLKKTARAKLHRQVHLSWTSRFPSATLGYGSGLERASGLPAFPARTLPRSPWSLLFP